MTKINVEHKTQPHNDLLDFIVEKVRYNGLTR